MNVFARRAANTLEDKLDFHWKYGGWTAGGTFSDESYGLFWTSGDEDLP